MVEPRVEGFLDLVDSLEQLRQTFEREELTLQRHQDGVRRGHRVDGQQIERRRTVDQHVCVGQAALAAFVEMHERIAQPIGPIARLADFELKPVEIHGRGNDVQVGNRCRQRGVTDRGFAGQHVVGRKPPVTAIDAEPGRRIALRVAVDNEDRFPRGRERCSEIDRRRGFADAALLVGDRQDAHGGRRSFCYLNEI